VAGSAGRQLNEVNEHLREVIDYLEGGSKYANSNIVFFARRSVSAAQGARVNMLICSATGSQ
jgi:hypothetical protein